MSHESKSHPIDGESSGEDASDRADHASTQNESSDPQQHDPQQIQDAVVLYAVRHGEKDSGPNPGLTVEGQARAKALAATLAEVEIDVIFTSDYRRCQETISPLAVQVGIEPTVIEAADLRKQFDALRALPAGTTAVLCGHANTVPMLVQALGSECPGLEFGMFPESAFDRLLVITFAAGEAGPPEKTKVYVRHYGERSG